MKKLLTVLCVAAFGIGAVAQAQVVKNESIIRTEPKEVKENVADIIGLPAMSLGQFMEDDKWYDTLLWHPEYEEPECRNGFYSTYYGDGGAFGEEVVPGVFSPYMNGTGEVGATYQTEDNMYYMYASIDVENAWVVGAIAIACRMGNTNGWERIQDKLDRFPQDPEHMNEVGGVKIPDMPFKLLGYETVQKQRAFKSYTEMIFDNADASYVNLEMPLSTEGRAETETLYLRYEPRENDESGRVSPTFYTVGGLFKNKSFQASPSKNFGLSFCVELTGDKTYDSLWNNNMGAKSNTDCAFVEEWSVWQRFDFRNHDDAWVGFWSKDETDIDVSLPWFVDDDGDESGFAPPSCPQKQKNSLFVYDHSLLRLSSGTHYKPTLYPIIQHSGLANESMDAYAQTVSVYPLPATDKVTVVALDPIQKIEIYNMAGMLVKVANMNESVLNIDVTSLVPGAYIAKITTENGVASKKLVV
ncbi:MAG: T9SS type A sorting domain-containing protein, partial [Bacteroidales bacterium]|nr:T9SS type A sorting domain-containing protein [Bacteroidales bacterium]